MARRRQSDRTDRPTHANPTPIAPQGDAAPDAPAWVAPLLGWYRAHKRAMPWRDEPTPYRVWISEIMLQQTQVDTVIPYFQRFLATFPTVQALAAADQQQVLKQWQGLGYYSRARNLHRCAQVVVAEHGGELPADFQALRGLPGLGAYTAAAVASIAFAIPVPVVDGNVLRVHARLAASDADIAKPATRDRVFAELLPAVTGSRHPSHFNQAMMELGALICRPSSPTCLLCPVAAHCTALAAGRVDELPVKTKAAKVPTKHRAAALIRRPDGALLLLQRPTDAMLGGLWELPTTADLPSPKSDPAQALGSALPALIGQGPIADTKAAGGIGKTISTVKHSYSHFHLRLHVLPVTLAADATISAERPHAWVQPDQLQEHPLDKATLQALALLTD